MDIRARIGRLARQYPDLVDVINLPNPTEGYRRTAIGYLGDPAVSAIIVESVRFGNQGMNGVQVRSVDPGAPNQPLSTRYNGRVLTVSLRTDATGAVVSTTDEVAAFIAARYPQTFRAYMESGSTGLLMPVAGPSTLDDGLHAVDHLPHQWSAARDGSGSSVTTTARAEMAAEHSP